MFDDLKKLKDLQDRLKEERAEAEKEGVKVVVNGKMEAEEIYLNEDLGKEKQEAILKDCFNEALKKVQRAAAQKMSQMKGFGF